MSQDAEQTPFEPQSSATAMPAGVCLTHGWHGATACPKCSTGPVQPLGHIAPAFKVYTACDGGHDWLPWLRLENGSHVTRCTRCGREEQWDE